MATVGKIRMALSNDFAGEISRAKVFLNKLIGARELTMMDRRALPFVMRASRCLRRL
jgi:hypothetical protein